MLSHFMGYRLHSRDRPTLLYHLHQCLSVALTRGWATLTMFGAAGPAAAVKRRRASHLLKAGGKHKIEQRKC